MDVWKDKGWWDARFLWKMADQYYVQFEDEIGFHGYPMEIITIHWGGIMKSHPTCCT